MINEMGGSDEVIPFPWRCLGDQRACFARPARFERFVAEMTISSELSSTTDVFHRTVTFLATSSIVITAVYILGSSASCCSALLPTIII
jgi:NADH-quinone oxidoreductase subunit M